MGRGLISIKHRFTLTRVLILVIIIKNFRSLFSLTILWCLPRDSYPLPLNEKKPESITTYKKKSMYNDGSKNIAVYLFSGKLQHDTSIIPFDSASFQFPNTTFYIVKWLYVFSTYSAPKRFTLKALLLIVKYYLATSEANVGGLVVEVELYIQLIHDLFVLLHIEAVQHSSNLVYGSKTKVVD